MNSLLFHFQLRISCSNCLISACVMSSLGLHQCIHTGIRKEKQSGSLYLGIGDIRDIRQIFSFFYSDSNMQDRKYYTRFSHP